jgi:hypothetical protein
LKPTIIICVILLISISGCSTANIINTTEQNRKDKSINIDQFNDEVGGQTVYIKLKNKSNYEGKDVVLSRDSTRFVDLRNNKQVIMSNNRIQEFMRINRVGGALDAFIFSILPAIVLSYPINFVDSDGSEYVRIPSVLAIVGASSALGYGIGKNCRYEFIPDTTQTMNSDNDK